MAITTRQAESIEQTLIELGLEPRAFHDWVMRRVHKADESGRRITRIKAQRGSHGMSYVYDPEGTDELPPDHEPVLPPG
jgi:hypothetical protein